MTYNIKQHDLFKKVETLKRYNAENVTINKTLFINLYQDFMRIEEPTFREAHIFDQIKERGEAMCKSVLAHEEFMAKQTNKTH